MSSVLLTDRVSRLGAQRLFCYRTVHGTTCLADKVKARSTRLKPCSYREKRRSVLLSVVPTLAPALLPDLVSAVRGEASLWQQELSLYYRQLQQRFNGLFGQEVPIPVQPQPRTLLSEVSQALLELPVQVLQQGNVLPQFDQKQFDRQFEYLLQQELPYFRSRGSCGHCGSLSDDTMALEDGLWVDFLSYIQFKTIAKQLTSYYGSSTARLDALDRLHLGLGHALVLHIRNSSADRREVLEGRSDELDSIRKGVRVILKYFVDTGYVWQARIVQFGLSKDEYENHMVWQHGEPAFLKYWLKDEALARSAQALQLEEGFQQAFVASTVSAYLAQCGVTASQLKRLPSYSSPEYLAEQWTLRRVNPPPPAHSDDSLVYELFTLDTCPTSSGTGCY